MNEELAQSWKMLSSNASGLSSQFFPILSQANNVTVKANTNPDTLAFARKLIPLRSPLVEQITKDIKFSEVELQTLYEINFT
jgi:hypothetical protein